MNMPFWSGGYLFEVPPLYAADGEKVVFLTDLGGGISNDTMFQTVPTLAGGIYHLSFAARAPQYGTSEFVGYSGGNSPVGPWAVNVTLNGSLSGSLVNNTTTWQYFSVDFIASGPTTLGFYCQHNPGQPTGWPMLDDVKVIAVPEPQCFSLLVGGLLALAIRPQRKHAR